MRTVSLFSGCGGMDLGFHNAGFEILRAIDNDDAAIAVHNHNFGGDGIVGDVTLVDYSKWANELGSVDVVLGGFPCQGFSKAGPKRHDDPRNSLYLAMRNAVRDLSPLYFVAENVEGLAQNFQGKALHAIQSGFFEIGYEVHVALIDAIAFGVPQHRRRLVFVGVRKDLGVAPFEYPIPTHRMKVRNGETRHPKSMESDVHGLANNMPETLLPVVTIGDVLSDLVSLRTSVVDHEIENKIPPSHQAIMNTIGEGQKLCNVRHSTDSIRTWDIEEAFGTTTESEKKILETVARNRRHKKYGDIPNGNPLPVDVIEKLSGFENVGSTLESLVARGFMKKKNDGYDLLGAMFCSGLFKRPKWNEPSPTVLTNFGNPRYFFHPKANRPFSLREAARLQAFPDSFEFLSAGVTLRDGYRLIGNAVPPKLATEVARSILRHSAMLGLKREARLSA